MDKHTNTPYDGETFARTMLEPLFYFAMSRTRDETEASALVSDIAEAVLTALAKGKTPDDPQAWVWIIAKNRYARYVKNRIRDRERTVSITMDEGDFDLPDTADTPEERLLLSEEEAQKTKHWQSSEKPWPTSAPTGGRCWWHTTWKTAPSGKSQPPWDYRKGQ